MIYHLIPAYGRDYKSKKAVLEDWNSGKDFRVNGVGSYINKEDALKDEIFELNIRYDQCRKVAVIKVDKEGEWK